MRLRVRKKETMKEIRKRDNGQLKSTLRFRGIFVLYGSFKLIHRCSDLDLVIINEES